MRCRAWFSSECGCTWGTLMMTRPPGLRIRSQLSNESDVVLDVLQKIDDHDLVEHLVLKGRFPAIELVHIVAVPAAG